MDTLKKLEEKYGGLWTGIKFYYDSLPEGKREPERIRLCDAIIESFNRDIILTADLISCDGARRSLHLNMDEKSVVARLAEHAEIPMDIAAQVIKTIPQLDNGVVGLSLGRQEIPDVIVSYTDPESTMRVIRDWQMENGKGPEVELTTFMAVCGNVMAAAYMKGQISLSLGCPTSRKHEIVERGTLVIGMPLKIARELVN
jgi:uncharacterized protein (DUF169 family)